MEIFQIIGLGIIAAILSVVIKNHRPEIAIQISILTGVIIFILLSSNLNAVFKLMEQTLNRAGVEFTYFISIIKIIGIAYVAQFGAEVCKDAGETAIASKLELAGKVLIAIVAAPIVFGFINTLIEIMP